MNFLLLELMSGGSSPSKPLPSPTNAPAHSQTGALNALLGFIRNLFK
jgi:hypothetical protein